MQLLCQVLRGKTSPAIGAGVQALPHAGCVRVLTANVGKMTPGRRYGADSRITYRIGCITDKTGRSQYRQTGTLSDCQIVSIGPHEHEIGARMRPRARARFGTLLGARWASLG